MKAALAAAVVASATGAALAALGVDVATPYSVDDWKCVVNNGRTFAIVRGWHSYGGFDSNVVSTVANAHAAGVEHVDVYMFPCKGKSASSQVQSLRSELSSNGVNYGMIWFDIEQNPSSGCGWSSDKSANCKYMDELVSAASGAGGSWGVYTSPWEWEAVMGSECTAGSSLPLWYAHYDGEVSFSDFSKIGGWTSPSIKQYSGTGNLCGNEVDLDYYP